MPDWISHILLGLIIAEILNARKKSLVVLGSVLPDIILKFYTISVIIPVDVNSFFWLFYPLHTIIGVIIFSFIITIFFKYDTKKTFLLLAIGAVSHILLDVTTKSMVYNIQSLLLFPFSWKAYNFGLIYTEQYWIAMIVLFFSYIIIRHLLRKYRSLRNITIGQY